MSSLVSVAHSHSLEFSGLFWGSGANGSNRGFVTQLLQVAQSYASHSIVPDRYTVESWDPYPSMTIWSSTLPGRGHHTVPFTFVYAVDRLLSFWPW